MANRWQKPQSCYYPPATTKGCCVDCCVVVLMLMMAAAKRRIHEKETTGLRRSSLLRLLSSSLPWCQRCDDCFSKKWRGMNFGVAPKKSFKMARTPPITQMLSLALADWQLHDSVNADSVDRIVTSLYCASCCPLL